MTRMVPGTRALRTFEASARLLSFTRAGRELGLTPAAVSYQIKEMEDQLGIVLFTRNSRSIQLTPAGTIVFEAAHEALERLDQAVGRARRIARDRKQLRISLGARFATNWLLPRLPQFRQLHPDLDLRLDVSDRVRDFDADDVDLAIRFGRGNYGGAHSELLFRTEIVPVCSPALLALAPLKQPSDLLTHMLCHVDCVVDGVAWPNWKAWMAAAGIEDFDGRQCVAFSESSQVIQAVVDGGAIGLVELPMVAKDLAQGRLVRLFDVDIALLRDVAYHLVYPEASAGDQRIRAFRDWILGAAGETPGAAA